MGLCDARACGGGVLGFRSFGSGRHGRVPVEQAAATVAGEKFALAELVPHLGADAHAAAGALLVIDAGDAGAARAGEAVIANKTVGLDERTEGFALEGEGGQFGGDLLVAKGCAGTGFVQGGSKRFHAGAGRGEAGFLSFTALQAGEFFVFKSLGFGGLKGDFVLKGSGLLWGLYGVELGAEACGLLAVGGDVAIKAGAERFLAGEPIGGVGGVAFGGKRLHFTIGM